MHQARPALAAATSTAAQAAGVTPLMAQLERTLHRIAANGGELPNNPRLGERLGHRRQPIQRALNRLRRNGRIQIERRGNQRRITVLSAGVRTDWGEARPGHAPYSSTPRGTSTTSVATAEQVDVVEAGRPPAPAARSIPTGPTSSCQYPLWADGEKPNGCYCSAPSVRGRSYCADHYKRFCAAGGAKA